MMDRLDLQNRNWPVEVFENWRRSGLLVLDMPYQRGEVWGIKRRRNFILSLLRGIPTPSIVVNDRLRADFTDEGRNGYAIVDGKQRVTTILAFLDDRLSVPRDWFDSGASCESLVVFSELAIAVQRRFRGRPLATAETLVKTLAEEKTLFDMINYGGLAQGEIDDDCDAAVLPARLDQSWTTRDVLQKLTEAAGILLERCDYDGHGWEEIAEVRDIARRILEQSRPQVLASCESAETPAVVSRRRQHYQKLKILCADKADKISSMIDADDFDVARIAATEIAGDLQRLRDIANHLADTE